MTGSGVRRRPLLLAAAAASSLAACGSGLGSDQARLRVLQASSAYASLDLFVDGIQRLSGIAFGSASGYVSVEDGTRTIAFASSGSTTFLQSQDRALERAVDYTVVVYGAAGALRTAQLVDDDSRPGSDKARVRVLNTASDAGTLDVYLTGSAENLDDATPIAAGLGVGAASGATELARGGWRLRVTAAGDTTDLRLDIPTLTLGDRQIATLVITPGGGGVLVNALMLDHGGTVAALNNPNARVRAIAAVAGRPVINVTAGTTVLASGLEAPSIGDYVLVPAGLLPLTLQVAGTTVAAANLDATGGADITLLVHGEGAATAQVLTITDDNRPPATTGNAKLRLLHGVSGIGTTLTLKVDLRTLAPQVPYASASAYASLAATTTARIEVTSPAFAEPIALPSPAELKSDAVYTVFVIGGPADRDAALIQDR